MLLNCDKNYIKPEIKLNLLNKRKMIIKIIEMNNGKKNTFYFNNYL